MTKFVQLVIDIISAGALYSLYAVGLALVFGILRLLNFAHGAFVMVGGYVMVLLVDSPLWLRILATLVVVVILAVLTERVAFRPVRKASDETLLITSFAVSYLVQSLISTVYSPIPRSASVAPFFESSVRLGDLRISNINIVTIAVAAVLLIGLALLLNRTTLGLQLRAASEDFVTARLVGVRANRVVAWAFVITGVLAAVGSVMLLARTGVVTPDIGTTPVLVAFVAIIIGGLGSLSAAVAGAFLLAAIQVLLQTYLPPGMASFSNALAYSLIIVVLVVRPHGLFVFDKSGQRV